MLSPALLCRGSGSVPGDTAVRGGVRVEAASRAGGGVREHGLDEGERRGRLSGEAIDQLVVVWL